MYKNELCHYGILGQKWGVRRYQNSDGTLTAEGKKRAAPKSSNYLKSKMQSIDREKAKSFAKKAVLAGAAAGAAMYIAKNPEFRSKLVKGIENATVKAGEAMATAAMISVGTIAINELSKKYAPSDTDSDRDRYRKQVLLDSTSAGIRSLTGSGQNASNNSGNKNNGQVSNDIKKVLGAPSNKGIDRSSVAYQNLFKDSNGNSRPDNVRSTIKTLASNGYDIEQIQEYLNSMYHSGLKSYNIVFANF